MAHQSIEQGRSPRKKGCPNSFTQALPWLWPHTVAMGLCQGLMLIPYLPGPLGMGLGAQLWEEPQYTCCFFAAIAFSMAVNDVAARRGEQHRGPLRLSLPVTLVFVAGGIMLVLHAVYADWGWAAVIVGCLGALGMGFSTACAQLSSARFIAGLPARQGVYLVLAAMLPSAGVLVLAGLCSNPWAGMVLALLPAVGYGLARFAQGRPGCPCDGSDDGAREVLGSFSLQGAGRAGTVAGCAIALGAFVVFAVRLVFLGLGFPATTRPRVSWRCFC